MTITEANATVKVVRALQDLRRGTPVDLVALEDDVQYLAERAAKPLLLTADHILGGRP